MSRVEYGTSASTITVNAITASSTEEYFAKIIRIGRKQKNWSQSDLASATKMPQPTISRFENGKGQSLKTYLKIFRALDLQMDKFNFEPKQGKSK